MESQKNNGESFLRTLYAIARTRTCAAVSPHRAKSTKSVRPFQTLSPTPLSTKRRRNVHIRVHVRARNFLQAQAQAWRAQVRVFVV